MKKIIFGLMMVLVGGLIGLTPVFAECPEGTIPVSILGSDEMIVEGTNGERCMQESNNGAGIGHILKTIIEIMTMGVGILGVVAIMVVGMQYLTARDDEGQVGKAKRRLVEIVAGLALYAGISSALYFLLPGEGFEVGKFTPGTESPVVSDSGQAPKKTADKTPTTEKEKSKENKKKKQELTAQAKLAKRVEKLQETVKYNAWPKYYKNDKWHRTHYKSGDTAKEWSKGRTNYGEKTYSVACGEQDCGAFVMAMMEASGWDKGYDRINGKIQFSVAGQLKYLEQSDKWTEIPKSKIMKSIKKGGNGNDVLEPGDIIIKVNGDSRHVILYIGKVKGFQSEFVEASHCNFVGMSARKEHRSMKSIYEDYSGYRVFRRTSW